MLKIHIRGIILTILFWYACSILIGSEVIPYPHEVIIRFLSDPLPIFKHSFYSLYRLTAGIFLALFFGILIGIKLGLSRKGDNLFSPLVHALHPIPKSALTPVFIIVFGIGDLSRILIVTVIAIFPIIIAVRDTIKNLDPNYFYVAQNLGLTKKQFYKDFIFPAILPELFTTTKIAVATGIAVLYLSETIGTNVGLGYYISSKSGINNVDMFVGIMMLSLIGYGATIIIDLLEIKYCKWKK